MTLVDRTALGRDRGRTIASLFVSGVACLWFVAGALAPLTPSHGTAQPSMVLLFAALPMVVTVGAARLAPPLIVRASLYGVATLLAVVTAALLWLEAQ